LSYQSDRSRIIAWREFKAAVALRGLRPKQIRQRTSSVMDAIPSARSIAMHCRSSSRLSLQWGRFNRYGCKRPLVELQSKLPMTKASAAVAANRYFVVSREFDSKSMRCFVVMSAWRWRICCHHFQP